VQAIGQQPQRAPDGARVHYEHHQPEQTALYCLVHQHAAGFIAHTGATTGAELPRLIKDEFDAFLECGILAHGFPRLRCGECGHDNLLAFSCQRRPMNVLFPISATVATAAAVAVWWRPIETPAGAHETAGLALTGTLLALGALEDWLLALPLPTEAFWLWGPRSHQADAVASATRAVRVATPLL
jgi:Protein of unknown function (DUF3623)/Transposase zinc-binding domain